MSTYLETIHVQLILAESGDALLWGTDDSDYTVAGWKFRQLLFAWHEESFYGTTLETRVMEDLAVTILPAEMALSFFGNPQLISPVEWAWSDDAKRVLKAAPALLRMAGTGAHHHPSYRAYLNGTLQWTWDVDAMNAEDRELLATFTDSEVDQELLAGLQAAFSAAVFERHYNNEAAAADLRREYPLLFNKPAVAADVVGTDAEGHLALEATDEAVGRMLRAAGDAGEKDWLVSIGWKPDTAPFRPALQLLEPSDEAPDWRLQLVLQDKQDVASLAPIRLHADGSAAGAWASAWTPHVRERSAGWLTRLRAALPAVAAADAGFDAEKLGDEAAWRFLTAESRRLLDAGWQVLLPAWWEAASRKKPRLRARVSADTGAVSGRDGESLFGLNALIDFDWRIAIGDADISEEEFLDLLARNERLVRFRGQWIQLDPALLGQIRKLMSSVDREQGLSFQDVLQLHLLGNADEDVAGGDEALSEERRLEQEHRVRLEVELNDHLAKLMGQLNQPEAWAKVPVPAGLRAELRSYQQDGFGWLTFLRRYGLGACLADDMGLGKTVQFIAYLLHIKESHAAYQAELASGPKAADFTPSTLAPSLLICPTSVLGNWQKELTRFAPDLRVLLHYGNRRLTGEAFHAAIAEADIVLTSYATANLDQELLQELTWTSLCLDEAQNIKNAQNKQSAAVRSLNARHRVALTGTPIENRLSELWSIYDFMNPNYLGSQRSFQNRFANAIEKNRDEQRTADLQKLIKPFMLRRKKKDPAIQLDLPDKNEMKVYVPLTAEQGAMYEQAVANLMERMQKLEGIERKGAILAALTQLKQLCDHPALLTKDVPVDGQADVRSTAASAIKAGASASQPSENVAVQLTEDTVAQHMGDLDVARAEDQVFTEAFIGRSAKLDRLLAMVKELREEGDRCLIFTQYLGMGRMLKGVLEQELAEPVMYLNGSTSKNERDRMIERFQSGDPAEPAVFILSLKAGGVGLNLTAANHVFHFDRWWNPAVENQATDRAYRMGQTRDVQVHKFISLGTLEERIDEMLENKMALSDNVISTSEGWITELSTDALKDLFTLRKEWVG
ncbi:helicase [Paenibacillus swuensis]|uniref:Helicase n=1 Tax=Paenibacillus swuensis TaxID=1178515 RepID=A0A172TE22_9BACL|nr:DEAD/DEAH box helicase [Paenibacillus swuensis]ANE45186.1 helicase [Paenibacillus swuensis]